jgi:hypothetical protein
MKFTEKVDVRAVRWLLANLSPEFIQSHLGEEKGETFNFTYVKRILQNYDKHNGTVEVVYSKKDKFGILRDYGQGIQGLPSKFRGLICKNMIDVDMVNAHPTIVLNLCKKHNVPCLYLDEYVKHRKDIIARGDCSKLDIIISMNKRQPLKGNISMWLKAFDIEMKQIQQRFYKMPEYEKQKAMAETNAKNKEGAFMSHLATTHEVMILDAVLPVEHVACLMFDGFMTYDKTLDLTKLSQRASSVGFDIQFSYKSHDNTLVVPEDWKTEDNHDNLYATLKEKYEKEYRLSYIEETVNYSYKIGDKLCFFNHGDCSQHFNNVLINKQSFFTLWNKDPAKQTFRSVGVYAHDVECPDGVLNLWMGYSVEKLPESDADISPMLNHIHSLFGTDADFILDWFANMFQFPSNQSLLIVLQGEEGCGKSVILDFMTHIMGKHVSIEIQDVKENLFGRFNGHLAGKVLLNINETDRREMAPFIEKLKSVITSPTITIEEKGQKKYVEDNHAHLCMTINPENVLPIKEGSRRFFYSRASSLYIGNTEYFNELFAFIERPKNQRAFYQFLMARPVKRKLTIKDIPDSEVMKELYELNRDPAEDFAAEFIGEHSSIDTYTMYRQFLQKNGLQFEISRKYFEMKFTKCMAKYGIDNKRKTVDGVKYTVYFKSAPLV